MFTKEHYQKIAKVIRNMPDLDNRQLIVDVLGEMFAKDNENFNWGLFWTACEPKEVRVGDKP